MKKENILYSNTTKELKYWFRVYAEILKEKENQYFRTRIVKDGKRIGEIKLLPLLCFYDPIQYVDSYLQEVEKREKEIK